MAINKVQPPRSLNPRGVGDISAPNALTPSPAAESFGNARIGYDNLLISTTTSAANAMLIPSTWERYRPSSGSKTVRFQLATQASIDFIGIAATNAGTHNGGTPISIGYASSVGGSVISLGTIEPDENNSAVMRLFTPVTAAEVVIIFNSAPVGSGLELGVIYAGKSLEMPHGIYGGHAPIVLNGKTKYQSTRSDSGNFLGRTITSQGIETSYKWRHLDPYWYREYFQPFVKSARKVPFFINWRPDVYQESAFGHTTGDISPMNMTGGSRLIEVSFNMLGHQDVIS